MNVNEDLSYAFALCRQFARMLGIWPDPRIPSISGHRVPSIRFIIVACIVSFYIMVPHFTTMIRAWGNVGRMVECVASANYSVMTLSKLFATWYYSETLRTLMTSVLADWMNSTNHHERNTMQKLARRGRYLSTRLYAIVAIILSFYLCFNLLKLYRTYHLPQRGLIYEFVLPYNVNKSPSYEITFVIQLCGGIFTALVNGTVDSFISILVLHVCAQLINLRMALNKLVDELANKSISSPQFKKGIATVTLRHRHLIRNVKTINKCFSPVLFVHMLNSTFQLCFQTFRVFTIITDRLEVSVFQMAFLSTYVIGVLFGLHINCYAAERLITESSNMAYGAYECKWYNISAKDAKNLILIVHGSSIPLRLTAGKFGVFSMETLGATVKTAMGYLSMLMTIKEK
ncbi:unnamed protein product [Lasius platythorax]|uniref:Odorant receptor n=1 Tax=Lasius platythorax TaxID=488582 RepID=A0AAV2NAD2_9HYME